MTTTPDTTQDSVRPHELLATKPEVATMARTSPSTVDYWLQVNPSFPKGFKLGVRRLWKRSDIEAWIEQQYQEQSGGEAA